MKPGHDEKSHSQMSGPVICDLPGQQVLLFKDWELVFCDVLSGVEEMVAAQRAADGQRTRPPLPPLGLYVPLYKAFLTISQRPAVFTQCWALILGTGATEQRSGRSGGRQKLHSQ